MELSDLKKYDALFAGIGALAFVIITHYVKSIMYDLRQIKSIPAMLDKIDSMIHKVENLMIQQASNQERLAFLEKRLDVIERRFDK